MEIDHDFELIHIKDEHIPIYKYAGNYYVIFNTDGQESYLAFRPSGTADDIKYSINKSAEKLPGDKIDYSNFPSMEGITTIIFGADGTAHPEITKATDIGWQTKMVVPSNAPMWPQPPVAALPPPSESPNIYIPASPSTWIPGMGYDGIYNPASPTYVPPPTPPIKAIKESAAPIGVTVTTDQEQPQEAAEDAKQPAVGVTVTTEQETAQELEQPEMPDGQDEPSEDLDDFLSDLFAVGEITAMKTVLGTKVQTFEVNMNSIKSLLNKTENEFLNEVQSRFIVNMNKIAQIRRENDTIGKTILNIKGIPSWMVPVVSGEFTRVERANAQVSADAFQVNTQPDSCSLALDQPLAPLYTSFSMDTDKNEDLPGSWRKTRTDFTVNAAHITKDRDGKTRIEQIKLPGNTYQTSINLTEAAINRMKEQQSKLLRKSQAQTSRSACIPRPSMYVRLLTVPKAIKSIEIDLVGTERVASINGFITRAPGTSSKPISVSERYIPLACKSTEAHRVTLEKAIDVFYPSIGSLIEDSIIKASNAHAYLNMLKWYQYDRNDLTLENWKAIGKSIKKNLSDVVLSSVWASRHSNRVGQLKRVKYTPQKQITPADNGKYQLCVDLNGYMADVKSALDNLKIPSTSPAEPTELSLKTLRYNNITNDPVHGLLFRSDVTGQFYTAEAYKRQLRHQLWTRLQENLKGTSATAASCDTLKLILTDLENYRWQTTKGILDNLKIKLSSSNLVSSATLNLLTSFDTSDMIGQITFIRHMDMFIENGIIRLNPFTKQYFINQSKEAVCCQHVLEDLKEHSLSEFTDTNGKCKYCLATLEHESQADDFGQTQFTTTRDMYAAGGEDTQATDPDHATLKYFLGHCLKWLAPQLQESGVVLSNSNTEQIIEDTIEYIKTTNPLMAKPYGPILNVKPIGWTPDLRLAILFDQPMVEREEGKPEPERAIMRNMSVPSDKHIKPAGTTSFFRVLTYFRENDADSTTDSPKLLAQRMSGKLIEMMINPVKSFPMLHNMLVMNRLSYCLGILIAHLNLTVNLEYTNTEKLLFLINNKNLYDICNTFQNLMQVILETHIKNLRTADKESQTVIMPHFDAFKRLFTADFNKDLYALGLTSRVTAEERALDSFNKMYELLQRQNAGLYDTIINTDREIGFAKYEASRSMVPIMKIKKTPSAPSDITNMSDYMDCWSNNIIRGSAYGERLWKQYANINKGLSDVPLNLKLKLKTVESPESLELETFQASVCSSKVLLEGPLVTSSADEGETIRNYLMDERELNQYRESKLEDLQLIDEELCQFNLAVPKFNNSLQSNQVYYPCAIPTVKKPEIQKQLTDKDETLRSELTSSKFKDNMRVLITYKNTSGYEGALDRDIFRRGPGAGVARINFLTNDMAAISTGSVSTVTNNELHKLVHDRRYVPGLAGSMPVPENIDEVPGFNGDFPTLVKPAHRIEEEQQTINRRRIFRTQNNGRSVINLIQWMTKDLSEASIQALKKLTEESEKSNMTSSSRYSIEKELASTEGYVLKDLIDIRWKFRGQISGMRLNEYQAAIPEVYNMSYLEYLRVMESLKLSDEQNLTSFRETIYAAIRLDIILHVKGLLLGQFNKKLDMDILDDIHDFTYRQEGAHFISMVTSIMDAMAKINIDPNVDSINKVYEARQMERVTVSLAARQQDQTLYHFNTIPRPEVALAENDPQDDEEEGDVDSDGQPTDNVAAPEGDEEDGFDVNDDPDEANWDADGNNVAGGNDHDI